MITAIMRTPSVPAIGRSKNAPMWPSDLIIEVTKCSSSSVPSTMPRMAGATGMPFSSMNQASTPKPSIMATPTTELLMAKAPRMQKTRMQGSSALRGMRRICLKLLIAAQPNGSISRLARMNSRNTA